jgi:16S rRNA (guanine527-N7)-methyltransferase
MLCCPFRPLASTPRWTRDSDAQRKLQRPEERDSALNLTQTQAYADRGLGPDVVQRLGVLGDLLLAAPFNVTSIREPEAIERFHFLDCLVLLDLAVVRSAQRPADLGSGAGLPALVLALALPQSAVTAVESQKKKCLFIEHAADTLELSNVDVRCERAEDYGRRAGREAHDVVVSRALAALPVVAEYSLPLLRRGGEMVAMKGSVSDQERIQAEKALAILGGGPLESFKVEPFAGAENRWIYLAPKEGPTPASFPRRAGTAARRPLGG